MKILRAKFARKVSLAKAQNAGAQIAQNLHTNTHIAASRGAQIKNQRFSKLNITNKYLDITNNFQLKTIKMTQQVKKPQLRGHAMQSASRILYGSLFAGACFAVWYKYRVLEVRKKKFEDFWEQYDAEADFEAMRKEGIFKGFEPS